MEEMEKKKARTAKHKVLFDEFIEQHLDPKGNHVGETLGIIVDFEYFLKLVTAIFFWKKFRFEYEADRYSQMKRLMLQ